MAEVLLRKNNTGRQKDRMRKKDRNKGLKRMKEYDMPKLKEKEEKLLALLFSLCGCCHSTGFVKWKQRINEEGGGGQWWRVRNGGKEGGEKMKTMEKKRSAGSKINLLCRAFTQPQTTDMFRQKPGPEEAACLWLMNKVKVSEVYYVNYPRQSPFWALNERAGRTRLLVRETNTVYVSLRVCECCGRAIFHLTRQLRTAISATEDGRNADMCPRERASSQKVKVKIEGQFENILLFRFVEHLFSYEHSSYSKCIQLHFPPTLYLPLGNPVISVRVIKTTIKSLSVWFPVTVFQFGGNIELLCVEEGCVSISNATDK